MRHPVHLTPAVLLVALAGTGCEKPGPPTLSFALNEKIISDEESLIYNEDIAGDTVAQAQLQGALEMLYGTPAAPGFLRPEEWIDDGYDPNVGDAMLSEERYDEIVADNEKSFAEQIRRMSEGEFDRVIIPTHMLSLRDDWGGYMDDRAAIAEDIAAAQEAGEDTAELEAELTELEAEMKEAGPEMLAYWYPTLADSAEMYRQQCYHCHGTEGGGNGSTSEFLNPRPRDYRRGIFKFTALDNKSRPRHEDLVRTLDEGIYGTSMPSFRRFSEAELSGLADYVRLLSMRGETELLLGLEYDADEYGFPMEIVQETYLDVWAKWDAAYDEVIAYDGEIPQSTPERIAHGRELYMDPKTANCVSCHGPDGRGMGPSAYEARELTDEEREELAGLVEMRDGEADKLVDELRLEDVDEGATYEVKAAAIAAALAEVDDPEKGKYLAYTEGAMKRYALKVFELQNERVKDDWGNEIAPRNLTGDIYRFGRRPIDLYRRIYAGINGTPMPSHAAMSTPDGERLLSDDDLWDIVHYVRSIPREELHSSADHSDDETEPHRGL